MTLNNCVRKLCNEYLKFLGKKLKANDQSDKEMSNYSMHSGTHRQIDRQMVGWNKESKRKPMDKWSDGDIYFSLSVNRNQKKLFSFLFKVNRMHYVNAEDRNNEEEKKKRKLCRS